MIHVKKYIVIFLAILTLPNYVYSTHNRAGEITYRQISDLTYEITVTTYTSTRPGVVADRDALPVHWGDNTVTEVDRIEEVRLPNFYKRNKYVARHTYPGPGTYQIIVEDPNRNDGVQNIAGSVNVIFAIKTTLQINPMLGYNNTPVLLNPPYDKAYKDRVFIHNPSAYDPDGDSLSYKITTCLGDDGEPLVNEYTVPEASKYITVDEMTGDLIWDTPIKEGIFNVAMAIEEWRDGVKIGQIIRDMQIEVYDFDNTPPDIKPIEDICIEAGQKIEFPVKATDPDFLIERKPVTVGDSTVMVNDTILKDSVTIRATGGPFEMTNSPAIFEQPKTGLGEVTSTFEWQTNCSHVREQPYQVIFKAEDNFRANNESYAMVDFEKVYITVVAPGPENVTLDPTYSSIEVKWDISACLTATGYNIYRRNNSYGFDPGPCETGVPAFTGYKLIGEIEGVGNTVFFDDNHSIGLLPGVEYCYIVTAVFPDGAESYASKEVCQELKRGIPIITTVNVRTTDENSGSVGVNWAKPLEIDTNYAKGPYQYILYRGTSITMDDIIAVDTLNGLDNLSYVDTFLNTKDSKYFYKIEFWNNDPADRFLIGSPPVASSNYLKLYAGNGNKITLDIQADVPWTDTLWTIYRQNKQTLDFDSIGTSSTGRYVDYNLDFETEYCYKAKAVGYYSLEGIPDPRINFSQFNCSVPIDTTPPCIPVLRVETDCDTTKTNIVSWTAPDNGCADDAVSYNVYFSGISITNGQANKNEFELLRKVKAPQKSMTHEFTPYNTGAYYVTAIDSFGNESLPSVIEKYCCIDYQLPNIFTPNGDNKNDYFTPQVNSSVEKVDMKIYNRWGNLVYETDDPAINWDGKHVDTGVLLQDGVYYYVCEIYGICWNENSPEEIPWNLVGFLHMYARGKSLEP